MQKTEVILREGNVVVRETTITESIAGTQEALFLKHLPSTNIVVPNVGTIVWQEDPTTSSSLPFSYIKIGEKEYAVCQIPWIQVKAYYPLSKSGTIRVPSFARIHPGPGWAQRAVRTAAKLRRFMFIAQVVNVPLLPMKEALTVQLYCVNNKNKAYAALAPNHYRDGRVCMGAHEWQRKTAGRTIGEVLENTIKEYLAASNNGDLNEARFEENWGIDNDDKWAGEKYYIEAPRDEISTVLLKEMQPLL